jgi:hypothetical protein
VICRHCGTEIADKAIVCYRCGAGTTEPVRKAVAIRKRRSPVLAVVIVLIVLLLAFFLARQYHLLGTGLFVLETGHVQGLVLIDFSTGPCLTPV